MLVAGLALGTAPQARAHANLGIPAASANERPDERASEWGGTEGLSLRENVAARTVSENDPASPPEPKLDGDTVRFGGKAVSRPVVDAILRASGEAGVDPVYMMALADKESSFHTEVKAATSSAKGLFQFLTGTWLQMIRDYGAKHGLAEEAAAVKGRGGLSVSDAEMRKRVLGLRDDPYVSGLMAAEMIKRDRATIESRLGRSLKTTELYLAHFLGSASAGRFLEISAESPDSSAAKEFGSAARANRSIFSENSDGKRRGLSVGEVHRKLDALIGERLDQYQAVGELVSLPEDAADAGQWEGPVLDARLVTDKAMQPRAGRPISAPPRPGRRG